MASTDKLIHRARRLAESAAAAALVVAAIAAVDRLVFPGADGVSLYNVLFAALLVVFFRDRRRDDKQREVYQAMAGALDNFKGRERRQIREEVKAEFKRQRIAEKAGGGERE